MSITAKVENGSIKPLEPLPEDWSEGETLVIVAKFSDDVGTKLDGNWLAEFEALAAEINEDDFGVAKKEIEEHRRISKSQVVREMDLD